MKLPLQTAFIDFQFIFENSNDGVLVYDLNLEKIVAVNQQYLDLLQFSEADVTGKPIYEIHNLENSQQFFGDIVKNGKENTKLTFTKKDDTEIWLRINSYKMPAPREHIVVSIYHDITELKEQQALIDRQNRELSAKNRELEAYIKSNGLLENFAFTAAHDLQSPINTMVSFSKILKSSIEDKDFEESMEYAYFINEAATNLKALIQDLLTYSRAKTVQYNPESFNLSQLVEQLKKELSYAIQKQKAVINIHDLPTLFYGDRVKIRQLFQNLIANAIKFRRPNIAPTVDIFCRNEGDFWQFEIRDNGIGIEEKNFQEVFKLFRRLNHKKDFSGSGIGLSLCQSIIEQHNGQIWLTSEFGKGTSFYFSVPKDED